MARRANKGVNPIVTVFSILLLVGILAGVYILYFNISDPFRGMRKLVVSEYMENSRSLSGNKFYVDCRMSEKIRWEPNVGGLWSVDIRSNGSSKEGVVAIFIPFIFDADNIQVGQELKIQVRVDRNGVLVAEKIQKI